MAINLEEDDTSPLDNILYNVKIKKNYVNKQYI